MSTVSNNSNANNFWKIIIVLAAAAILVFAIGAKSVFSNSDKLATTNVTVSGNSNGGQQAAQTKSPDWFGAQVTSARQALADLEIAQGAEERGYKSFLHGTCEGIENPTGGVPCKERWVNSHPYEVKHGEVTRAESHLQNLLMSYETEAKKVDFKVYPSKLAVLNGRLVDENGKLI